MRCLVLFYSFDDDFVDPIAIVSEGTWDAIDDAGLQGVWNQAKDAYDCRDAPPEYFREAWVTIKGAYELFDTPELEAAVEAR